MSRARDWLLRALTVGLAASITLSETTLVVLAVVLVVGRRAARPRATWPLIGPVIAFALWTLVTVLASRHPGESLLASRGLLTLGAFYVVLNALPDTRAAGRFASGLLIAVATVALLSIVQVGFCPPGGTLETGIAPVRLLMRKCARASSSVEGTRLSTRHAAPKKPTQIATHAARPGSPRSTTI